MNQTSPSTFRDLFNITDFSGVEIPIIQRDYAQGRSTAVDIRNQFVDALHEALTLPPDSPRLPLNLDFVYGSMEESDLGTVFSPLDGQQRLTTLFLLHWYLAVHDEKLYDFQAFICRESQSRFSYKVRASADEFFDTLVNAEFVIPDSVDGEVAECNVMSRAIEDQSWFFLAWRQDPTVASVLRVLDTIHERFKDTSGLYDRLVDPKHPVITFQFLNLRTYGLSDELYIKMNARGKALTEFEAFKARLEQKISGLLPGRVYKFQGRRMLPKEYFGHRVDSTWADVFWNYRDKESRTFDRQFMNFVRGLVTVTFPYAMRESDPEGIDAVMRTLSEHGEHYHYYRYESEGCLTTDFAEILISVLDQISSNGRELQTFLSDTVHYDERDMFMRILRRERLGVLQAEWVQFYGYCVYLYKHEPAPGDERFCEWMRIISHLALNTIINRADDFIRALVSVRTLLERIGDSSTLEYVALPDSAQSGLNQQQWREERVKAQLIGRCSEWRELIYAAENHKYFRGQIEFLLDFSGVLACWLERGACGWSDEVDTELRAAFKLQFEKSNSIFDESGLRKFDDFMWERTVLTYGDYLLSNGRNLSLLDNGDRIASWKRLLRGSDKPDDGLMAKRELIRSAMSIIDPDDAEGSLKRRIDEYLAIAETDERAWWRRMLVECPAALEYCKRRFLRATERDGMYLMARIRTSAYHAELRTYHLCHVVLPKLQTSGELKVFTAIEYTEVCDEAHFPLVVLIIENLGMKLAIQFKSDKYHLCLELDDKSPGSLLDTICERQVYFRCAEQAQLAGKSIGIDNLIPTLKSLSDCIEAFMNEAKA